MNTTHANTVRRRFMRFSVLLGAVVFVLAVLAAVPVLAQSTNFGLDQFAGSTNLGTEVPLIETVARIINIALGILGVLAVGIVLYGGYLWMMSRGDAKQIEKAKKVLAGGIIGLAIILASFAIASFAMNQLRQATNQSGPPGGGGTCPDGSTPPCPPPGFGGSYLGVRSSAPRNSNVSLCAAVQAGFNDVVQVASIGSSTFSVVNADTNTAFTNGTYQPTTDATNFAFVHQGTDFAPNTNYRVTLQAGSGGIRSVSNTNLRTDVTWQFKTGTQSDNVAPTIGTVEPPNGAMDICRATPVQIAFSESMLATSFAGNVILRERANPSNIVALSEPSFGDSYRIVTLHPLAQLSPDTQYEVFVRGGPTGVADTCGNTMASDYTWNFTTGQTVDCRPTITSITPVRGDYGQNITLAGQSLFLDGEVEFNGTPADTNSFDGNSNILCWNGNNRGTACSAGQIVTRVPVGADTGPSYDQDGATTRTGPVRIVIGNQRSNELQFAVTSPVIERISPSRGGEGQFVTLTGWNFGDTPGEVRFVRGATSQVASPPVSCTDWWSETEVTMMVPSGLTIGDFSVEVRTAATGTNGGAKRSNSENFSVTAEPAGPGICSVSPNQQDVINLPTNVTVTGERFAGTPRSLNFGTLSAGNIAWTGSQQIDASTPTTPTNENLIGIGRWPVCVTVNGKQSNCKTFTVTGTGGTTGSGAPPRVVESRQCTTTSQSPSPWKDSTDACGNARVSVRFTEVMDQTTLTVGSGSNITVERCGNGAALGACNLSLSFGAVQYLYNSQNEIIGFATTPGTPLQKDYWYKGTVSTNVRSADGVPMSSAYEWVWRVGSDLCPLQNVKVDPGYATIRELSPSPNSTQNFTGSITANNCNSLDPSAYVWQWTVTNNPSDTGPARATLQSSSDNIGVVEALDWTPSGQPARITGAIPSESKSDTSDIYISTTFCRENLDCNACGTGISRCVSGTCEPVITNMTPADGAVGSWVTLRGCYFGTTRGTVTYGGGVTGAWPDPAICGNSTWTNTQVISEVPTGATDGVLTLSRPSPVGTATTPAPFDVNSTARPGLCRVIPSFIYESQLGTATATLGGKGFGGSAGSSLVRFFAQSGGSVQASSYASWSDSAINAVTPTSAGVTFPLTGMEMTAVIVNTPSVQSVSNALNFDIIPGSPPGGGEDNGPLVLTTRVPTPSSNQVCRNAEMQAGFDGQVRNKVTAQDIKLYRISGGACSSTQKESNPPVTVKNWLLRWLAGLFGKSASAQTSICLVETSFRAGGTTVTIVPRVPLVANAQYRVELRSPNAVTAGNIQCSASAHPCDWTFTAGPDICKVASVSVTPPEQTFTASGQSVTFQATALSVDNLPLAAAYQWSEQDIDDVVQITSPTNGSGLGVTANNANGSAVLSVVATGAAANSGQAQGHANATVYLCEVPWETNDAQYDFRLRYCRGTTQDVAGQLPGLNIVRQDRNPATTNGLLREYFFKSATSDDAVGLRIYQNLTRMSPKQWYESRGDITLGSTQPTTIDGYVAMRDQQTVYVGAVSRNGANNLYTNIYVLSLSQNAGAELTDIFNKMVADWQFNTAVPILGAEQKGQYQRDLRRLQDLSEIRSYLAIYNQSKGKYPELPAGSFIAGMSTSAWPSWQATLGNNLSYALPTDPLNTFSNCPADHDQATCWRAAQTGVPESFVCPNGSHVYQYRVGSGATSYTLNANLEAKNVTWQGQPVITVNSGDSCDSTGSGASGPVADTSPPSSVMMSLVGSPTTDRFTISWTAAADTGGSGLSYYELWRAPDVSGSPGTFSMVAGNIPSSITATTDSPPAGIFWYGVRAVDAAGNGTREQTAKQGTKDTTAPSSPSCSPGTGTYASSQGVTCQSSDQGTIQTGATVRYVTGASATPTCSSPVFTNPTAISSTTVLSVVACDGAGNQSSVVNYTYTINTVNRSVSINGSLSSSGWLPIPSLIYMTTCIPQSGTTLISCRTEMSTGSGWAVISSAGTQSFTQGVCHNFRATETDTGGSVTTTLPTSGIGFCYDSLAPVVTAFTSQQTPTTSPPVLNWTVSDTPGSGVARIEVWRFNNPGWSQVSPALSNTVTSWTDSTATTAGTYTYTIYVVDQAGNNITSSPVTVTVNSVASDTTAPTVSITAPSNGSTVSNTVTVTATASDNVGVSGVQFKLDGSNLGSEDTSSPYSITWDTTTALNGTHMLTATARDAAGNQTTSSGITVTVVPLSYTITFQSRDDAGSTISGAQARLDGTALAGVTPTTYAATAGTHTVTFDNNLSCYTFSSTISPTQPMNVTGAVTVTGTYNRNASGQASGPSPANSATNVSVNSSLSWSAASCASTYDVYFGTNPASLALLTNITGTSFTPGSLNYSTTYYWRINARNAVGVTTGTVWSFTTTAPPTATVTFQTVNDLGQAVTGATARLDGTYVGLTQTQSTNVTYGSHTASFDNTVACHTLSSVSPSQPMNLSGNVTVTGTFTRSLPGQVGGADPANNTTDVSAGSPVALSWSSGTCTSSFDVYIGTTLLSVQNATTASPEYKGNITSNTFSVSVSPATTYYWRIDARNSVGVTKGQVWNFATSATPPSVVIVSPPDGSLQTSGFSVRVQDFSGSNALVACYYAIYNDFGSGSWVITRSVTSRACSGIGVNLSLTIGASSSDDCQVKGTNTCRVFAWNQDTSNLQGQAFRDFSINY